MKTQIAGFGLKDVIRNTGIAGWFLLSRPIVNFIFTRKRDITEYATLDISAYVFILYAVIAFFLGWQILLSSRTHFGQKILTKTPILIFLLYSIWGVVSILWSVNPMLTGFRAFECIAMMLLIVALIQELLDKGSIKFVILWALLWSTWSTLWGIITKTLFLEAGPGGGLDYSALLESSQMTSTVFFFFALYFVPHRWYNYLIMFMAVFSMSTVGYIGIALGAISAFWGRGKVRLIAGLAVFVIFIAIIAIGPYQLLKDTVFFDRSEISIEDSSGRNHLMDIAVETIEENPWGLGFFAAEPYVIYGKGMNAISAHNSILSAGMGLGIPGIIILSLFFLLLGKVTFSRYISPKCKPILIGSFIAAFIQCMGNPSVGTRVYGAWSTCMFVFVLICGLYVNGRYLEPEEQLEEETSFAD